jgi:hypothetical protein
MSEFEQSLDYDSVYADNAIIEIGYDNAKIIFYENLIRIDEQGKIDKKNKHKLLRLEIKLPHETLKRLSIWSLGILQAKQNALRMKKDKNDPSTERAYSEYNYLLGSTIYDTAKLTLSQVDLDKLTEALTNLAARINTAKK